VSACPIGGTFFLIHLLIFSSLKAILRRKKQRKNRYGMTIRRFGEVLLSLLYCLWSYNIQKQVKSQKVKVKRQNSTYDMRYTPYEQRSPCNGDLFIYYLRLSIDDLVSSWYFVPFVVNLNPRLSAFICG